MASFDLNTRMDRINRRTVPVSSGTYPTGKWISITDGYASTPTAYTRNAYLCILGNELRPDSQGSGSVTVQYGQNLYTLNTYGANATITAAHYLRLNGSGDLVDAGSTDTLTAVAIAENGKGKGVTGQKIRTLY